MISTKIVIDASQVTKTFNKIESEAKQTGNKIDNAFKVEVDTSKVNSMFDGIKGQVESIKDSFKNAFDFSQIANFTAGGLVTGGIETAISGVVGAFSSAIEKGNEFNNALLDLQAKTGATASEMLVLEQSAKDLFIGGIGESVAEATKVLGEAQLRLGDVFGGQELTDFTKKANALGKAYDLDVNEVIKKSAPFIKQYGLSGEEAFNLVAMSMKEGATASDDVLDSLAEYSQLASKAGYSAEQFTNILTTGAQAGIFNTDKLADSIKEAEIRIKAGDFANAFKGINESASSAEKALIAPIQAIVEAGNRGELTIQETLQKSTKLIDEAFKGGKISESLASQLQVAIAGTPAEDIGTELFGKIFGAPLDDVAIQNKAKQIGDNLSNAVGQYTTLDSIGRNFELAITSAGKAIVTFTDDALKFLSPFLDLYFQLLDATTLTLWSNIFSTVFGIVKKTFMDTYNSVKEIVDIFSSMFGEAESGIDIIGILATTFEFLGRYIGTLVTLPFQALHKILQGVLYVVKELILFVKGLGDRFNDFVNSNKMVSDFVEAVTEKFRQLGKWISESAKSVKGFLQSIGLLSKDKPMKEIKEDTKEIKENTEEIKENVDGTNNNLNTQKVVVKTLQEQYDALLKATQKLAQAGNFGTQYDKNIAKLQELKAKLDEITKANQRVEFDINMKKGFKEFVNDYFNSGINNIQKLQIRPKELTLKPFTPIKVESETNQLEIDIAKGFVSGFEKVDFTNVFKKKENAFDETLETDRVNLLTSLQKNELSYQDYANRLNEIDKKRLETSKEYNNEFINALNETLALSFSNVSNTINESLVKSLEKQDAFSTGLTDNITMAMLSITTATTEMALSGKNLLKSLAENTIKTARAMFNAYLAPLLAKEILEKNVAGIATFGAYSILGNSFLSIAEGLIAGFKDGVINLQGAGTSRSDSIPAMLSKGESVINARSTQINEPFLRYANNGGDLNKLFAVSMNTRNLENLIAENNMILQNKNLVSNVNVNNRFEVANSGINVKFKR